MTKLFKENKVLTSFNKNSLNNHKVTVYNQDAYIWAKNCKEKFDVAIIDFPDPSNYSLGKLYSLNFYNTVKKFSHQMRF